tara:strand:+ start:901 stop:1059 length:159 start_codon:yes stop_codon:yes gene_type:complete
LWIIDSLLNREVKSESRIRANIGPRLGHFPDDPVQGGRKRKAALGRLFMQLG